MITIYEIVTQNCDTGYSGTSGIGESERALPVSRMPDSRGSTVYPVKSNTRTYHQYPYVYNSICFQIDDFWKLNRLYSYSG